MTEPEPTAFDAELVQKNPERTFTSFESGQVRPLALSSDEKYLYAVNTPDNRLDIFRAFGRRLRPVASVPVGLEPVAIAERAPGASARGGAVTFTAVPPGNGRRIGIDRDLDGVLDGDERKEHDDRVSARE